MVAGPGRYSKVKFVNCRRPRIPAHGRLKLAWHSKTPALGRIWGSLPGSLSAVPPMLDVLSIPPLCAHRRGRQYLCVGGQPGCADLAENTGGSGALIRNRWLPVLSGLQPQDWVVTAGTQLLARRTEGYSRGSPEPSSWIWLRPRLPSRRPRRRRLMTVQTRRQAQTRINKESMGHVVQSLRMGR